MAAGSSTPERARHDRALLAWQLALLRFAVTMDNADRLALLAIAAELDAPGFRPAFKFFCRTSAELCHAIINPRHPSSDAVLQQHLKRSNGERLKRTLAAALPIDIPCTRKPAAAARAKRDLWRGLRPTDRGRT